MKRRLFNLAAVVSLVLCLASVAMWVRSSFVTDQWSLRKNWTRNGQSILFATSAHSTTGGVEIVSEWGHADQHVPDRAEVAHMSGPARELIFQSLDRTWPERLGLRGQWEPAGSVHGDDTADGTCIYLNFPYWFPAIAFGGLPLIGMVILIRRRRRVTPGRCASCGYDLRATPQGGRCPECGSVSGGLTAT
jgi:hypothetical protein